MSISTLNEIVEKSTKLTSEERRELIQLLQEQEKKILNGGKGYVSPDTIWVIEHHAEYAGNYIALKDGKLVTYGKTIKVAALRAKKKGVKNPSLIHFKCFRKLSRPKRGL